MSIYTKQAKEYTCPVCGKTATGRADQKFCSVQCKNAWHNERTRSSRLSRNRILTALGRNYSLLCDALASGELSVSLARLEDRGFRPCYVTGYKSVRYGNDVCRCFDISYCRSASRIYKICREEED